VEGGECDADASPDKAEGQKCGSSALKGRLFPDDGMEREVSCYFVSNNVLSAKL
jgi:hypothetical protein